MSVSSLLSAAQCGSAVRCEKLWGLRHGGASLKMAACAVLFAGLTAGCGDDETTSGVLVVPFQLGNDKSCEEVGVDYVRAVLDDNFLEEQVDCAAGEVRFDSVPEGSYRVSLFGMTGGFPVMDSLEGVQVVVGVVGHGTVTEVDSDVVLTSAPARLLVRWDFGFASCEGSDIQKFEVSAWEGAGSNRLLSTTIDCDEPGEGTSQYRTVEDPDRKLGGELLGEVSIQPLTSAGDEKGDAVTFSFAAPGAGHPVRISLECDSKQCTGSGLPDEG